MKRNRICKHRFLAGFLAFLMFFALFPAGILVSVKNGILGAGSIRAIAENEKVYDTICELLDTYLEESFKETEIAWIIENENFEEVKKEMILFTMELAFEKTDEVNVEHIVDMLIETVDEEAEAVVDDVLDEIEEVGEDFDARDNEYVQDVVDRFGLEVDESFYDEINKYAEDADKIDEYREDIKAELEAEVIEPAKEEAEKMEEDLEANLKETMEEYYNSEGFATIEKTNDILGYAATGLMLAAVVCFGVAALFALLILILYRRGLHAAFPKFAVNTGIVGVMLYCIGKVPDFAGPILDDVISDNIRDVEGVSVESIEKIIDFILDSVFAPFRQTGIAFLIAMVICIVIWAVGKIVYNNRQKNDNDMNYGGHNNAVPQTDYNGYQSTEQSQADYNGYYSEESSVENDVNNDMYNSYNPYEDNDNMQ